MPRQPTGAIARRGRGGRGERVHRRQRQRRNAKRAASGPDIRVVGRSHGRAHPSGGRVDAHARRPPPARRCVGKYFRPTDDGSTPSFRASSRLCLVTKGRYGCVDVCAGSAPVRRGQPSHAPTPASGAPSSA